MNKPINYNLVQLLKQKDEIFDVVSTLDYPTIAEVIDWLYEKHSIWISVSNVPFENHFTFEYSINTIKECKYQYGTFLSPTEAYESAIEYCLNNLI